MGTPFESKDDKTNRTLRRGYFLPGSCIRRSHPATIILEVSALTSSDYPAAKPVIIANIPYWQYQKHSGHWMGFSWFLWLNETFILQVSSGVYGFSSERDSFVKNECKWFNGGFIECRREVKVLGWSNSNFSLPICANGLFPSREHFCGNHYPTESVFFSFSVFLQDLAMIWV